MDRRPLTLSLAGLLAVGMVFAASVATVPYVALLPGPAYDTLGSKGTVQVAGQGKPVLEISGRPTFEDAGQLDLLTILVDDELTLGEAISRWFSRESAVVPRDVLYPPDQSDEQVQEQNKNLMTTSQGAAASAALRQLGIAFNRVVVEAVPAGSPSAGRLARGDVLTTVDGKPVLDASSLRTLIGARRAGQPVTIGYRRGAAEQSASITTTPSTDATPRPLIGVETREEPLPAAPKVTVNLQDVGGPSAGLMFALGIIEKLGKDSLTGGKHVAGTGEISADGAVGPIGGISQKLVGAKRAGATVFLVPAGNCEEATRNPVDGLQTVRVATLAEALDGLAAVRRGAPPARTCGP